MVTLDSIKFYTQEDTSAIKNLRKDVTQVWVLDIHSSGWLLSQAETVLTPKELEYVQRFTRPIDTLRSTVPRVLLHIVLAEYAKVSPIDIAIERLRSGQPYVESIPEVYFSISHSGEYAVVSISLGGKVGVDVEKIASNFDYLPISERFFHTLEHRDILDSGNYERFYHYWTAKEAFVKAIGEGLKRDFNSFYVDFSKQLIYDLENFNASWRLVQNDTVHGYSISIVLEVRDNRL